METDGCNIYMACLNIRDLRSIQEEVHHFLLVTVCYVASRSSATLIWRVALHSRPANTYCHRGLGRRNHGSYPTLGRWTDENVFRCVNDG